MNSGNGRISFSGSSQRISIVMDVEKLKQSLCETFCSEICMTPVPVGWAISGLFEDSSGDPICFYMIETTDGIAFEDDGDFLAEMVARDIDIEQGRCGEFLSSVLSSADADWDKETFQIKSKRAYTGHDLSIAALKFLFALVRVRDIGLFAHEMTQNPYLPTQDHINSFTQAKGDSYLADLVQNNLTNLRMPEAQKNNRAAWMESEPVPEVRQDYIVRH